MVHKQARYLWLGVIPILLIMTATVMPWLNYDIIWFDEYRSLERSGAGYFPFIAPWSVIWNAIQSEWPPLYFLLLWAWDALMGADAHFLNRVLQWLTASLAVSMMYRTATALFKQRTALWASGLLAFNVMFLFYQHELRPYALWVLLSLLVLYFYWRVSQQTSPRRSDLWGLLLSIVATLYTHQLSPIFIGLLGIYHLLSWKRLDHAQWNKILWYFILSALVYAPGLASMLLSVVREIGLVRPVDRVALLQFSAFIYANGLTLIIAIALLSSLLWIKDRRLQYLWFVSAMTVIAMVITDLRVKFFFHPRYLMITLAPFTLILAFVLDQLAARWRIIALATLFLWSAFGIYWHQTGAVYDVPEDIAMNNSALAMRTANMTQIQYLIDSCLTENGYLAFATNRPEEDDVWINPLAYYLFLTRNWEPHFGLVGNLIDIVVGPEIRIDELIATTTVDERIDRMVNQRDTVWVLQDPTIGMDALVSQFTQGLVARDYQSCGTVIDMPDLIISVWHRDLASCQAQLATCQP